MNKETLKGWKQYRLNDLFIINPPKDNISNDTEVSFIAMKDVSDAGYLISSEVKRFEEVKNGYTYFKNDDIILAKITPCFENGKMAVLSNLTNNYGVGSTEFYVFRKRPNANILPQILYYIFKEPSFRKNAIMHMSGAAGQKRVQRKFLEYYPLSIPLTTAEQQEIVQVLDTMSNIIRLREECISHAQDLIPALFQEMFKQYIKQKDKHISIGSVTSDTKQINPLKFFETEFYYIDIASINNDTGIIETPKIININETPPSRARKLVQTNDVIISMTRPYLKGFSIIPKHLDGQIVSTGFSVLRSIPEKILPLYLFAYARTDMFVGQLIPKMKGANYPAVRDSDVRSVKIPLPPIELQEQFAEKVEKINSYIKEQQEELANAKQMFQSLLHHAFTGELTRRAYGKI